MANIKAKRTNTKVTTGEVRLSYCHLVEPHGMEGQEPKYSVSIIIDKKDTETLKCINDAIAEAKESGKTKWNGKIPPVLKTPLRDGDVERPEDEAYQNSYFLNASSKNKPGLVDKYVNLITDPMEVYSGCYARVTLNFYAFNAAGNRGIACGLGNVQKLRDGDSLGGATRAENDFDAIEEEDFLG